MQSFILTCPALQGTGALAALLFRQRGPWFFCPSFLTAESVWMKMAAVTVKNRWTKMETIDLEMDKSWRDWPRDGQKLRRLTIKWTKMGKWPWDGQKWKRSTSRWTKVQKTDSEMDKSSKDREWDGQKLKRPAVRWTKVEKAGSEMDKSSKDWRWNGRKWKCWPSFRQKFERLTSRWTQQDSDWDGHITAHDDCCTNYDHVVIKDE